MKLNLDCVRDILLDIEEISDGRRNFPVCESNYKNVFKICQKYDYDVLFYHLKQCLESGYFSERGKALEDDFAIFDLTQMGRGVIAKIKDNSFWNKFKRFWLKAVGATLPILPDLLQQFTQSQTP